MGLLDFDFNKAINSDQGRLGLGLLAAAGPSKQGFGQRLQSAVGYVQGQQDRDTQKQMQQFQMQELMAQVAARKREAEKLAKADKEESDIQAFSKKFYTPEIKPEIYADGTQMGPAQPGSFDMQSMLKQLPGAGIMSPLKAIEYAKKFAPKEVEYSTEPRFTEDNRAYVMGKDGSVKFLDGGIKPREKLHFQDVGGEVKGVDPFTGKPVSTLQKSGNPFSDLVVRGVDGSMVPNAPLMGAKKQVAAAGASRNVVNMAAPENAYNASMGQALAKDDAAIIDAARNSGEAFRTAQSIRNALKGGAITGTFAEQRYTMLKALETAGLVGEGKAASTEQLTSNLAGVTLDWVKSSGLGSGSGFSNADRDFLEKAKGGTISMTAANALRVADLAEKAALAANQRGKTLEKSFKSTPSLANIANRIQIPDLQPPAENDAPAARQVKRTGVYNGRKVIEYSDGSVEYGN